jgi:hypothetical protein
VKKRTYGLEPVSLAGLLWVLISGALGARGQTPLYLNPKLGAEQRAADLVKRMTLEPLLSAPLRSLAARSYLSERRMTRRRSSADSRSVSRFLP